MIQTMNPEQQTIALITGYGPRRSPHRRHLDDGAVLVNNAGMASLGVLDPNGPLAALQAYPPAGMRSIRISACPI
jgi:hypothetical protein